MGIVGLLSAIYKVLKEMKEARADIYYKTKTKRPGDWRVCFLGIRHVIDILTPAFTVIFAMIYVLKNQKKEATLSFQFWRAIVRILVFAFSNIQSVLTST